MDDRPERPTAPEPAPVPRKESGPSPPERGASAPHEPEAAAAPEPLAGAPTPSSSRVSVVAEQPPRPEPPAGASDQE